MNIIIQGISEVITIKSKYPAIYDGIILNVLKSQYKSLDILSFGLARIFGI